MREEIVEFITIREDFSEYEAENGQILKVKQVVTDIINSADDDKKKARIGSRLVSHIVTPTPIDTSSLEYEPDPNKVTQADEVKDLDFRPLKEVVNIYETKNSIILVIPRMEKIILTRKKNTDNAPHLRFKLVSDFSIIEKYPKPLPLNF